MGVSVCTLMSLIHCGFLLLLIREACKLIIGLFERTFEKKTKKEKTEQREGGKERREKGIEQKRETRKVEIREREQREGQNGAN